MDLRPAQSQPRDVDVDFGRAWRDHRRHVLDIALRMLGNLGEAEDVVQEAFTRLLREDLEQIDDVGGWLVVVVSRLCLDKLRSGRRHPTSPDAMIGDRPSDRMLEPADRVTLDDSVRIALHVMLERLTPAERTAFVLHDVFQYPFDSVAEIVGRTPAAVRQLASRARRALQDDAGRTRVSIEPAEQRRVTEQFIAACSSGELDALLAILDPEVDGCADLGGDHSRADTGRVRIAPLLLQFLGPTSSTTLLSVPAGADSGVVVLRDRRIVAFVTLEVHDGRVDHIDALVDPVKLAPIAEILGS
jgi:RNA polymerase sigma-70 factor, ECF subfamily